MQVRHIGGGDYGNAAGVDVLAVVVVEVEGGGGRGEVPVRRRCRRRCGRQCRRRCGRRCWRQCWRWCGCRRWRQRWCRYFRGGGNGCGGVVRPGPGVAGGVENTDGVVVGCAGGQLGVGEGCAGEVGADELPAGVAVPPGPEFVTDGDGQFFPTQPDLACGGLGGQFGGGQGGCVRIRR